MRDQWEKKTNIFRLLPIENLIWSCPSESPGPQVLEWDATLIEALCVEPQENRRPTDTQNYNRPESLCKLMKNVDSRRYWHGHNENPLTKGHSVTPSNRTRLPSNRSSVFRTPAMAKVVNLLSRSYAKTMRCYVGCLQKASDCIP